MNNFEWHESLFINTPVFGFLVMSPLGFTARVDNHIRTLAEACVFNDIYLWCHTY